MDGAAARRPIHRQPAPRARTPDAEVAVPFQHCSRMRRIPRQPVPRRPRNDDRGSQLRPGYAHAPCSIVALSRPAHGMSSAAPAPARRAKARRRRGMSGEVIAPGDPEPDLRAHAAGARERDSRLRVDDVGVEASPGQPVGDQHGPASTTRWHPSTRPRGAHRRDDGGSHVSAPLAGRRLVTRNEADRTPRRPRPSSLARRPRRGCTSLPRGRAGPARAAGRLRADARGVPAAGPP